jgi:hypothetical protein
MTVKDVQCKFCRNEIRSDLCELATIHTDVDGKEKNFCCVICARQDEDTEKK